MAAASKPALFGLPWERIQELVRCNQVLRINARGLRARSAELRDHSYLLQQENANFREFLAETMLSTWSTREHWRDRKDSKGQTNAPSK